MKGGLLVVVMTHILCHANKTQPTYENVLRGDIVVGGRRGPEMRGPDTSAWSHWRSVGYFSLRCQRGCALVATWRLPSVMRFRVAYRWSEGAIMPSRYHGIFILFIATVAAGAPFPPVGRWCTIWRTLSSVSVLLTLPETTHQWSLLGLNLWSNHAADKPPSNELLERDATRFSRGECNNIVNDVKKSERGAPHS